MAMPMFQNWFTESQGNINRLRTGKRSVAGLGKRTDLFLSAVVVRNWNMTGLRAVGAWPPAYRSSGDDVSMPPVSNTYAALVSGTVLKIPDGVGEVTWEGTLAIPGYLDVGIGDERLPQRSGSRLESTAEQRTFAEGCEVVVLDERGQVVAEQKGNFARGDTSAVNNFPLPPGTYTVRTKVAGEAARDERVTVTAGTWTRVSFGQSSPDAPAPGGGCGKGKCG